MKNWVSSSWTNTHEVILNMKDLVLSAPFPQADIIGAMVIVRRVRGKIIRSVLCNTVCSNCAQCNAHHMNRLTVRWIGFCLTGPNSLCLDSFLYCVSLHIAYIRRLVTW